MIRAHSKPLVIQDSGRKLSFIYKDPKTKNKFFIKLFHNGKGPQKKEMLRRQSAEAVGLSVCRGLAIPNIYKTNKDLKKSIKNKLGFENASVLKIEYLKGRQINECKWSASKKIAAWLFIVEQLEAIRLHSLLYTDIKPENILYVSATNSIYIVDFEGVLNWSPLRHYKGLGLWTPNYTSPETFFAKRFSEKAVVYQLGMLLGALIQNGFVNSTRTEPARIQKLKTALKKSKSVGLYKLLERMISHSHCERQHGIDQVLDEIYDLTFDARILKLWSDFRRPYLKKLNKLNLRHPKIIEY